MAKGIVIGAGPSLYRFNHLELLTKSDYKGTLLITDKMLVPCLKMGITPDRFKDYHVFTLEDMQSFQEFFPHTKYASKIQVHHSPRTRIVDYIRECGYKITCDHWEYLKVTSSVGTMAFCYGWRVLNLREIALIGMDYSIYPEPGLIPFAESSECFKNAYQKIGTMVLAPNHQTWYEVFYDLLELAPYDLNIINCTEGGVIKGIGIKEKEFRRYLW